MGKNWPVTSSRRRRAERCSSSVMPMSPSIPRRCRAPSRQIADILSAYDDLIENNTRRISILEEMARTIYREWFVDFSFPDERGSVGAES